MHGAGDSLSTGHSPRTNISCQALFYTLHASIHLIPIPRADEEHLHHLYLIDGERGGKERLERAELGFERRQFGLGWPVLTHGIIPPF